MRIEIWLVVLSESLRKEDTGRRPLCLCSDLLLLLAVKRKVPLSPFLHTGWQLRNGFSEELMDEGIRGLVWQEVYVRQRVLSTLLICRGPVLHKCKGALAV